MIQNGSCRNRKNYLVIKKILNFEGILFYTFNSFSFLGSKYSLTRQANLGDLNNVYVNGGVHYSGMTMVQLSCHKGWHRLKLFKGFWCPLFGFCWNWQVMNKMVVVQLFYFLNLLLSLSLQKFCVITTNTFHSLIFIKLTPLPEKHVSPIINNLSSHS